jgi:hypothetical protein
MGLASGILGVSLGTLVIVSVAAYQSWTPVLDLAAPLLVPPVGVVTGLLAEPIRRSVPPTWCPSAPCDPEPGASHPHHLPAIHGNQATRNQRE